MLCHYFATHEMRWSAVHCEWRGRSLLSRMCNRGGKFFPLCICDVLHSASPLKYFAVDNILPACRTCTVPSSSILHVLSKTTSPRITLAVQEQQDFSFLTLSHSQRHGLGLTHFQPVVCAPLMQAKLLKSTKKIIWQILKQIRTRLHSSPDFFLNKPLASSLNMTGTSNHSCRWNSPGQGSDIVLFLTAGRDHCRPGRWHGDHPRVRAHLPAARAAPATDPDCPVHGRSDTASGQSTCTGCAVGGGGQEGSLISSQGFLSGYKVLNAPLWPEMPGCFWRFVFLLLELIDWCVWCAFRGRDWLPSCFQTEESASFPSTHYL